MNQFVISILARDRVGIIADVTTVIRNLDGNLADLSQTVLCGHFTMILVADFPPRVDAEAIRQSLQAVDPEEPFEVGIRKPREALHAETADPVGDHYILTAVGPDEIGLVAAVSTHLREHGINIDDLTTRVEDGNYTMILSIDFPADAAIGVFKQAMQEAMDPVGVRIDIQHHEIFRATNEI